MIELGWIDEFKGKYQDKMSDKSKESIQEEIKCNPHITRKY